MKCAEVRMNSLSTRTSGNPTLRQMNREESDNNCTSYAGGGWSASSATDRPDAQA